MKRTKFYPHTEALEPDRFFPFVSNCGTAFQWGGIVEDKKGICDG